MKRAPALVRLSWDHHHGLVLGRRLERKLAGAGDTTVDDLYAEVVRLWAAGLLPHFRAEGECLLARLIRHTGPHDELIQRTMEDHLSLEALTVDMRDAEDRATRRDRLGRCGEILRAHIRWEESILFETAQALLSNEELAAVSRQLAHELPPLAPARPPER